MITETKINEIFSSIQGEGPVVGYKQLFVRFCSCNLNCNFCDTEFDKGEIYSPQTLYEKICSNYSLQTFHSLSLTGGEPLLSCKFLKEFLPLMDGKIKIYLETNATLIKEFSYIKDYIDIVAADIKLPSATGIDVLNKNEEFIKRCIDKYTFAKIVFDDKIEPKEIDFCSKLGLETGIELILQPKMTQEGMSISSDFCEEILNQFTSKYKNTRLIPQVHKFIDVR